MKVQKYWAFPGSSVGKTPCFQCRGWGLDPWLGNWDPTWHMEQPKKKKTIEYENILMVRMWKSRKNLWAFFKKQNPKQSSSIHLKTHTHTHTHKQFPKLPSSMSAYFRVKLGFGIWWLLKTQQLSAQPSSYLVSNKKGRRVKIEEIESI